MNGIRVLYFGPAAEDAGLAEERLDETPADLEALREILFRKHPALVRRRAHLRFAVNREYAGEDHPLRAGDEVAVLPPVAGGNRSEPVRFVTEPLDAAAMEEEAAADSCGAVVVFQGTVRAEGGDHPLAALEYTAYEEMAVAEIERIRDEALRRFPIVEALVRHRLGRLRPGETSVAIVVAAPHRPEAFEACRYLIDELKRRAPIWKREIREGESPRWVTEEE